jgi:hypothetical protein
MSVPAPQRSGASLQAVGRARPTPQQVHGTRRWLLLFLFSPFVLVLIVVLLATTSVFREPAVPPMSVPPGYRAISDAYYGYSVPSSYRENPSWSDANGDFFYGTPRTGWVAETLLVADHAPGPAAAPPTVFTFYGELHRTSFRAGPAHPVRVPDTTVAYEETITRPGGWRAVAVDTWLADSHTQMWLLVKASPAVTHTVIASLRGS